jgi:O-antigen/teichoic acid export membrane protein
MSAIKKLFSETAIYGLPSILGRFLNYLLTPLYTYHLLPSEYGVVTEMYAYASFLGVLLTYGMETAFFRFFNSEEHKTKVYSTAMVSLLCSTVIFIILAFLFQWPLAALLANKGGLTMVNNYAIYLCWFAIIVAIDAITAIPFARLRAENKALKFAVVRLVNLSTNIFFNLFFILGVPFLIRHHIASEILLPISQVPLVSYIFISNLLSSGLTLLLLLPESRFSAKLADAELLRKMLRYGLPILVMGLAGMVNDTFDRILLKWLLPLSPERTMHEIGVYGACYKLSIIMTICIQAFRFAAEPFFFARYKEKGSEQVYAEVMKFFVLGCSLVFLITMLYLDLIKFFIGSANSSFLEGLAVVPILLLANMCLGIYYNLSIWFKLTDRTTSGALISIFGAVLTLGLNMLLIPTLGYMGSAYTTLICYASMMVISFFWGRKYFPIPYQLGKIAFFLLSALVVFGLSKQIENDNLMHKIGINTALLLVYILLAYLIGIRKGRGEIA